MAGTACFECNIFGMRLIFTVVLHRHLNLCALGLCQVLDEAGYPFRYWGYWGAV